VLTVQNPFRLSLTANVLSAEKVIFLLKTSLISLDIESFLRLTKNMPNVGTLQNPQVGVQPSPQMGPGANPEQSDPFHLGGH